MISLDRHPSDIGRFSNAEAHCRPVAQYLVFYAVAPILALLALTSAASAQAQVSIGRISAPKEVSAAAPVTYIAPGENAPATLVLRFAYQDAMLEILEATAATILEQHNKTLDYEIKSGSIAIVIFGGTDSVPSGTLAYLHVRVKPSAATGNVLPILNATTHGANGDADYVDVQVSNGNVRVIDAPEKHSADTEADWTISLEELLRVAQLYNVGEYHCDSMTDDGYETGSGDQSCSPHTGDYNPADWRISFSELLRVIQLYNAPFRMYHADTTTEDGFAPGPFGYAP